MNASIEGSILEAEYIAYMGPAWEYYLNEWRPTLAGQVKVDDFNLGAFTFSAFWLAYRKMYGYALIVYGLWIIDFLVVSHFKELLRDDFSLINQLIISCTLGFWGNRLYFHHTRHAIERVHALGLSQADSMKMLAKKGGVNVWGMLGLTMLFVIVSMLLTLIL